MLGLLVHACTSEPAGSTRPSATPPSPQTTTPRDQQAPLSVFVSIPPQAYLVERIGGELVHVEVLVGPGRSPHTFSPTPKQAARLSRANVFFASGVPFETELVRKIRANAADLYIVPPPTVQSSHVSPAEPRDSAASREHPSPEHHTETELDPHNWLDPKQLKRIARRMRDALAEILPAHTEQFDQNLATLETELDELDRHIAQTLQPFHGRGFLVVHAAFGHFARAYDLRQIPLEAAGKAPTPRQLTELLDIAQHERIRTVFYQPQFDQNAARILAETIDGQALPWDPLTEDTPALLRRMASDLVTAFQASEPE